MPVPPYYFAREGKVYVKLDNGDEREITTALTSRGRDLEKFEAALTKARAQREQRRA
jgi:hypothetical protein